MKRSHAARADEEAEAARASEAIARSPRYGHYARIPARVCRCLEHFGLAFDRAAVSERLRDYYLFVGVADDAIDAGSVRAGADILRRLFAPDEDSRADAFAASGRPAVSAPVELATAALRRHLGATPHPSLRERLTELYEAVVREREAATMRAYVAAREEVGRLTAEVSYLLIRPLLATGGRRDVRRFLAEVGAVGCLLDSAVDLKSDERLGLLNFGPALRDRLRLAARTLRAGCAVLVRHPRLLPLFLAAAADTLRDRLAARAAPPVAFEEVKKPRVCERTA